MKKMKRNRFIWPVVLLLILVSCSPLFLTRSQSAYEKGIRAYTKYLNATSSVTKATCKKEAIKYLKKSLTESRETMTTDPFSPNLDKGCLFFLKASVILSELDYKNSQSYIKDGFGIAKIFRINTQGKKNEASGKYWFAKIVSGLKKADRETLSEALAAVEYALENLDSGPEKAECASIQQILQFRLEKE